MTKRVSIEVGSKITVDADTSRAERKLRDLGSAIPDTIGHGGKPVATPEAAPGSPTHHLNQQYFHGVAERMMASVMPRIPQARTETQIRDLGDRLERALHNAQQSGNKDLVDSIEDLRGALDKQRLLVEHQHRQAPPPQQGVEQVLNNSKKWLSEQSQHSILGGLTKYLGGSVGGAAMGAVGKLASGPLGWITGGLSAANWAFNSVSNAVTENNALARNEVVGYADLARQYGSDKNFMRLFRDDRGWTNDRFARLGYTATQASHVAALYDRPGGMANDTEQILRFSRTMGLDESRTASAARTYGQVGIGGRDGGEVGSALRTTKQIMKEAIQDGLSGSDTMQSLVNLAQKAQSEGRSMSNSGLAYYGQIMGRLNDYTSPAMRGQNATNIASSLLGGLGKQDQDPGMEYLLIKSLGTLPSAAKLGLKGEEAKGYDALLKESPLEAGRSLLKHLEKGENPALTEKVFAALDQASGGSAVLKKYMYEQFGLSDEQALSLIGGGGAGKLFKTDQKGLQRLKDGAGSLADTQGNNNFASDTMYLRVAESDRELIKSLGSLRLTGELETRIAELKGSISNLGAVIAQLFGTYDQAGASQSGQLGSRYKDPSHVQATEAVTGDSTPSVARDGPLTGSHRVFAAIAAKESSNGQDKNMNVQGKAAVGLYQMQSRWLLGENGWAKAAGVTMRRPDGKPVTTEAEARAWQLANPQQANQIAEHRLSQIQDTVKQAYAKRGLPLTDLQEAQFTGVLWHRNGGGNLSAAETLPLTNPANPLYPLATGRNGALANSAAQLAANDRRYPGNSDGVSDREYATKLGGLYTTPGLPASASGTAGAAGTSRAPGGEKVIYTQTFGANKNHVGYGYDERGHLGEDYQIGDPKKGGEAVHARTAGKVIQAGKNSTFGGNTVIVKRPDGYEVLHGHLQAVKVKVGQDVTTKTVIGTEGNTGGPAGLDMAHHLHVEVRNPAGKIVNPAQIFGPSKAKIGETLKGYRTGGYTGDGPRDAIAGVVHHEEYVVDAPTAARHKELLRSLTPHGAAATEVKIDLGGTLNITSALPLGPEARTEINQAYSDFQARVQRTVTDQYSNQRGPR